MNNGVLATKASERLWEKLAAYSEHINVEAFDRYERFNGAWDVLAADNDCLDIFLEEVEEEFEVELDSICKDWVVHMFSSCCMRTYNEEMGKNLEPRE